MISRMRFWRLRRSVERLNNSWASTRRERSNASNWRTTSLYFMIDEDLRLSFELDDRALFDRFGGTFPFSDGTFLVTARRVSA